jgi:phenylalanyl-tRNA synthetase beta chain
MQIPTEWIKEFCGIDATNDQMVNQLTMAGVECCFLDSSTQEILDLSLTPNRADCFSVMGICRELAVLNNLNIKTDKHDDLAIHHQGEMNIDIESPNDCPVFMTRIINNIDSNRATPD